MNWERLQKGTIISTRDGTGLSADFYFPEKPGRYPVLVVRTPYGKSGDKMAREGRFFSDHGYVVIISDVRGRGGSDGDFHPYLYEGKDGYDLIEWAASQEWSSGNVGTFGESYVASVQWRAALEKPPHLKAMISCVVPSDPFVEDPTGVRESDHLSWLYLLSEKDPSNIRELDWDKIAWHLPLYDMDSLTGKVIHEWREAFDHTTLDDYLKEKCYQNRFSEIDLPVMHISGWYDAEQIGTPLNYMGMRENAASESSRNAQKLVMGPWQHAINEKRKLGKVDFGEHAVIDLLGLEKRWFDRWLKGINNGIENEKKVSIFVMGDNVWREEAEWPIPGMSPTPYYFHSRGGANTCHGDGYLSGDKADGDEPVDSYSYDPLDPYPSTVDDPMSGEGGPDDYSQVEERKDVLVFTSDAQEEKAEITGPVTATLYVSSDVEDTDFNVKLLDVWPSGFAQRLCDGVIRCRYREGMDREVPMSPGKVYRLGVNLWNTSHVFLPGHRIRVEVSSSSFPKYSRNQNVWEPLGRTANTRVANQVLYHDSEMPSAIFLPLIRRN